MTQERRTVKTDIIPRSPIVIAVRPSDPSVHRAAESWPMRRCASEGKATRALCKCNICPRPHL